MKTESRVAFETWYCDHFAGKSVANMPIRSTNKEYVSAQQQIAWMAWQVGGQWALMFPQPNPAASPEVPK
jgi:hypothetical protein